MIQRCIPSIQEIISKVRTFSEYDPETFDFTFYFEYNEDDFNIKSIKYSMESFDPLSNISERITDMNKDFAYRVQMRYIEVMGQDHACIPSITDILHKLNVIASVDPQYLKPILICKYSEDGIKQQIVFDSTKDIDKQEYEFAKSIRDKYVEKMKKENNNMPYDLIVDFNNPLLNFITNAATSYKVESVKESDKGLTVTATKQPKGGILPYDIKDYKIYNGKALVVWFTDGSFTKAVVSDGEEFDFYTGLMICLFKKYLGENGSKKFNKMMEVAMKKLGDIDKNKEKQAEEKALAEKKRRKADMKRKAKALKKKEEAIDIQKQGFVRAMQEIGEDDRK